MARYVPYMKAVMARIRRGIRPSGFVRGLRTDPSLQTHHTGYPGRQGMRKAGDEYDPIASDYGLQPPDYCQPRSWFEDVHLQTPSIRTPHFKGPIIDTFAEPDYDDALMTNELLDQAVYDSHPEDADIAPGEHDEAADPLFLYEAFQPGDMLEDMSEHPWHGIETMDQELFDSAMRQVLHPDAVPDPEQPDLCTLVNEAFDEQVDLQLEAMIAQEQMFEQQMEPDPFDEQQMLYDQEMQHLMNPFMMPGPGFGPG